MVSNNYFLIRDFTGEITFSNKPNKNIKAN